MELILVYQVKSGHVLQVNNSAPEQQHQGLQKCSEVVVSVDTGVVIKGNVSKNLKWRKITEYRHWIWGAILTRWGERKCACNTEAAQEMGSPGTTAGPKQTTFGWSTLIPQLRACGWGSESTQGCKSE